MYNDVSDNIKSVAKDFADKMETAGHITFDNYWVVYEAVIHGYHQAMKKIVEINKSSSIHIMPDQDVTLKSE
jgi:hypothetical protein